MNTREWITLIMACFAIGAVFLVIATDEWFRSGLIPAAIGGIAFSVLCFTIWLGGMFHGQGLTNTELEEECKRLWILLDDISTAGDMFKPEINGYFHYVNGKCDDRDGMFTSDGYTIFRQDAHLLESEND